MGKREMCTISLSDSGADGPNAPLGIVLLEACDSKLSSSHGEPGRVQMFPFMCATVFPKTYVRPSTISQVVGRTPCVLGHMPNTADTSSLKGLCMCTSVFVSVRLAPSVSNQL